MKIIQRSHLIPRACSYALLALAGLSQGMAQDPNIDAFFERIRSNEAMVTAFVSQMPKGGDLHHHYSGAIYAESYVQWVTDAGYFVDPKTWIVVPTRPDTGNVDAWISLQDLRSTDWSGYLSVREHLMEKWSVKDYGPMMQPHELHFFQTFGMFAPASGLNHALGLLELKQRAKQENVSYIETMYRTIPFKVTDPQESAHTAALRAAQTKKDAPAAQRILGDIHTWVMDTQHPIDTALAFDRELAKLHADNRIDDADFTMRYQNYVVRVVPPVQVFTSMIVAFESAARDTLIEGVNIVAPEDHATSMQDYWLHMQMYAFCHAKYPDVKYAMHAGELVEGYVAPEELMWHVTGAVDIAQASRIGHGVDIPYEHDNKALMKRMRDRNIAVEINLTSNEFILGVKDGEHPILLYDANKVPLVISTDDAGVLRSSLTEQFVILAMRYPQLSYSDMKRFIFNSITYSFMGPARKAYVMKDLEKRFARFEADQLKAND
jgi:adenosine deaminase